MSTERPLTRSETAIAAPPPLTLAIALSRLAQTSGGYFGKEADGQIKLLAQEKKTHESIQAEYATFQADLGDIGKVARGEVDFTQASGLARTLLNSSGEMDRLTEKEKRLREQAHLANRLGQIIIAFEQENGPIELPPAFYGALTALLSKIATASVKERTEPVEGSLAWFDKQLKLSPYEKTFLELLIDRGGPVLSHEIMEAILELNPAKNKQPNLTNIGNNVRKKLRGHFGERFELKTGNHRQKSTRELIDHGNLPPVPEETAPKPISPAPASPKSLIRCNGGKSPVDIDMVSAVQIMRDPHVSDDRKDELFTDALQRLNELYGSGEIGKKALSRLANSLKTLDDARGLERFQRALDGLDEKTYLSLTRAFPANLMRNTDMSDIEVCPESRVAAYLRHYSSKLNHAIRRRHKFPSESDGGAQEKCRDLFDALENRYGSDGIDMTKLAAILNNPDNGKAPSYIIDALKFFAGEDFMFAQELVEILGHQAEADEPYLSDETPDSNEFEGFETFRF